MFTQTLMISAFRSKPRENGMKGKKSTVGCTIERAFFLILERFWNDYTKIVSCLGRILKMSYIQRFSEHNGEIYRMKASLLLLPNMELEFVPLLPIM